MTALKTADADRFLRDPGGKQRIVLIYGPDPGGVSDRAASLAHRLVGDDALALVRIEADELAADPGRLADEAYGASLFAGRRVLRVRAFGNRSLVPALEPILGRPPEDTWIVVEAGDLRKTAPLRRLFEGSSEAVAIACYPDNEAAVGRLIDAEVEAAGLTIAGDARSALVDLLGADRGATRSEIRKLCLYARDAGAIALADVVAAVGDGAAIAMDDAVEAAARGDLEALDRAWRRLLADGVAPSSLAVAAERHFLQLHRFGALVEGGGTIAGAIDTVRPPPSPQRRALLERQLRLWPRAELDAVVERLGVAILDSRKLPGVAPAIIFAVLVAIGRRAARMSRARGPQPD